MSRYYDLAAQLEAIATELEDDLELDAPPVSESVAVSVTRVRKIVDAAEGIRRAAELVLDCEPSTELAAEVRALEVMCQCGRDRGTHLAGDGGTEDGVCFGFVEAAPTIPAGFSEEAIQAWFDEALP